MIYILQDALPYVFGRWWMFTSFLWCGYDIVYQECYFIWYESKWTTSHPLIIVQFALTMNVHPLSTPNPRTLPPHPFRDPPQPMQPSLSLSPSLLSLSLSLSLSPSPSHCHPIITNDGTADYTSHTSNVATMSLPSPPISGILPTVTGEQVIPKNIIQKMLDPLKQLHTSFESNSPQTLGGGHLKFYVTV